MLSGSEIAAQIISFLLLFFILRIFFWKRLLKLLDERREKISGGFKAIEEGKATIEKIRAEYQDKLNSIEGTAKAKIQEAVIEGRSIVEELKKSAKEEAQKIVEQAKEDTRYEVAKAKEQLKDEIADLVLDATEHLLEERMTEAEDKKIVRDFLKKVGEK